MAEYLDMACILQYQMMMKKQELLAIDMEMPAVWPASLAL